MSIDTDLRTWLLTTLGSGWTVEQSWNEQEKSDPRCWFNRTNQEQDLLLDNIVGLATTRYTVELVSEDLSAVQTGAQSIKDNFHSFTSSKVLMPSWSDHDDDYQPVSLGDGDQFKNLADLELEVIHQIP